VCPWSIRFSTVIPDDSPFQPRESLAGKDARTLARELLSMSQAQFSAAFKGSPMKRAKLRGLKRNAAVVLGNVATVDLLLRHRHARRAMMESTGAPENSGRRGA
jgi:epoxyqueuosine reductase